MASFKGKLSPFTVFSEMGEIVLDYHKLVELIPVAKWEAVSDRLVDLVLTSKNDENMPSQLANRILYYWQQDVLKSESGIAALLEAAILLEPDKATNALSELQIGEIAEQVKKMLGS